MQLAKSNVFSRLIRNRKPISRIFAKKYTALLFRPSRELRYIIIHADTRLNFAHNGNRRFFARIKIRTFFLSPSYSQKCPTNPACIDFLETVFAQVATSRKLRVTLKSTNSKKPRRMKERLQSLTSTYISMWHVAYKISRNSMGPA